MSNNTYSTGYSVPFTGNQAMMFHRQVVQKEKRIMKHHELTTNVQNNIHPPLHDATPDQLAMARSVYGVRLRPRPKLPRAYDRILKPAPDWDPKVKNDAYRHLKTYKNNARMDEDNREIPVLANAEIGHRLHSPPERFKREHARVMVFFKDMFRKNGVDLV